jgi:hypothetical protein
MEESVILKARQRFELAKRPKGRVWQLDAPVFVRVVEMLMGKLSYEKIAQLCLTDLQIPKEKSPSYKALWKFWGDGKFWMELLDTQRIASEQNAKHVGDVAAEKPVEWEKVSEEVIHQRAFELSHDPTADPALALQYANASLRLRRLKHDHEKAKHDQETKVEAGINALKEEIRGDSISEELLKKLCDRLDAMGKTHEERLKGRQKLTDPERDAKIREMFGIK